MFDKTSWYFSKPQRILWHGIRAIYKGIHHTTRSRNQQRWASTQASRTNARHRSSTRHSIERSEISYFFEKLKAKIVASTAIVFDRWRTRFLGIKFFTFNEKKIETYTSIFRILYIIFNFVKNCLHVCSLILFLGMGNIPEEIWSISKGCPPLSPAPSPTPQPLFELQKWAATVGTSPD